MSTKHTAGPWTLNKGNKKPVVGLDIGDNLGLLPIAPEVHGYSVREAKANARLIAAAPELLAELREILSWARIERAPLRQQEVNSIERVIEKATGERA